MLYRSWLALPLIVKDELIGILVFAHTKPDRFDPAVRSLASAFANQAVIAIENARLFGQAQEAAVKTERTRFARDLHDRGNSSALRHQTAQRGFSPGAIGG